MSKNSKQNVGAVLQRSGASFRVWAPFANQVALIGSFSNWGEVPMESENDGYWSTFVHGAMAGQEYKFVIRNGQDTYYRNDPRALHFVTSAGNSVIANDYFDWGDDNFTQPPLDQQVIYELHVGTFNRHDPAITGTFQEAGEKLDHLASLGVNMIELMPISSMCMDRGWGYAIDYIFSVESLYGGRYGFMQFVKAAHQRGIGVILDVVYNHFGPDSNMDLWKFDGWQQDGKGGIYFYNDWRSETPWGNTRPDFGKEEVRQYILDNVRMWMHDCRIDGLRVDSTIFIRNVKGNNNDPGNDLADGWWLLQQINSIAHKIRPESLTIAEDVADNDYITKPTKDGGAGFSAQWELNFQHALRDALWTSDPSHINLTGLLTQLSRRFNGYALQRIIYADSHDSAANGSARLTECIAPGKSDGLFARKQSLIGAALILTAPGIPMLFQGQELMEGGVFNDWQSVDWSRAERFAGIIQAYQHLIGLRKNSGGVSAGLTGGDINLMHVDDGNKVIAYHRWKNGGPRDDVVVVINFANHQHLEYNLGLPRNGTWHVRFNSTWKGYDPDFKDLTVPDVKVDNGSGTLVLPPSSVIILSQDD